MTDEQMVQHLLARDPSALSVLQHTYGAGALAVAQRIVQNRETAEECVQDALLAVWETVPPQRPERLRHYFIALARSSALDRYRAEHREKRGGKEVTLALEELNECIPGPEDVEDQVAVKALGERINVFLAALPERERDAFLRRYYYLEPLEDAAKALGLTRRHLSVVLFRTRKKLKAFLQKEDLL
ncbi:MAG: sigma-70 family RNA polymerase sigma factor [Oscillospiraceae bacterium]|nr:sigma-70 family RNA polymerase sigma factor [Oscillospiraceae bacterium]